MKKSKTILYHIITQVLIWGSLLSLEFYFRSTPEYKRQFTPFISVHESFLSFSPEWSTQYFGSFKPSAEFHPFPAEKESDEIRIFALGGSSMAGFPYSYHNSSPSYLQEILQSQHPDKLIRVINVAQTAINSYQIADILPELLPYSPDLFVIYSGHNEFYGAYGSGSSDSPLIQNHTFKKFLLSVNKSGLIYAGRSLFSDEDKTSPKRTTMAAMIKHGNIRSGDDRYTSAMYGFKENLHDIAELSIEHDIPVFISTIASNISGQAPLGSNEKAKLLFENAHKHLSSGDLKRAKQQFTEAKESDPLRFRAPDEINTIIRNLAKLNSEIYLQDFENHLQNDSTYWQSPERWFTDHLHLSSYGYYDLAKRLSETISENFSPLKNDEKIFPSIIIDELDQIIAKANIQLLTGGEPFSETSLPYEQRESNIISGLSNSDEVQLIASRVLAKNLPPSRAYLEATKVTTDSDQLAHYRGLHYWQPFNHQLFNPAVSSVIDNLNNNEITTKAMESGLNLSFNLLEYQPDNMALRNMIAALFIKLQKPERAILWLEDLNNRQPGLPSVLYNLARAYQLTGDIERSKHYFSKFKQL